MANLLKVYLHAFLQITKLEMSFRKILWKYLLFSCGESDVGWVEIIGRG